MHIYKYTYSKGMTVDRLESFSAQKCEGMFTTILEKREYNVMHSPQT